MIKYSHKYSHGLPFTPLYTRFLLFTTYDSRLGHTFSLYLLQLPLNLTTDQKARGSNPLGRTREKPSDTIIEKTSFSGDFVLNEIIQQALTRLERLLPHLPTATD